MIGLYGGSFDPPHNGHVALARAALEHFALERLLVTPARHPPLKDEPVGADAETRLRLAEAAFAGLPRTEVSRLDIDLEGPAFSHATARVTAERWGDVILLVGADRFADFLRWRAPDEVLQYARLGVATRPGVSRDDLDHVLARVSRPDRVELFEMPAVNVSSRDIRRRIAAGEPIENLVPPRVAKLIAELGLYRP